MNSTAPAGLKAMMDAPDMHGNDEVLSEPPLDGKPGQSPFQARGDRAAE